MFVEERQNLILEDFKKLYEAYKLEEENPKE